MSLNNAKAFNSQLKRVASYLEKLVSEGPFLIISHYDADGLSSAAIIANILIKRKTSFHIKIIEQPSAEDLRLLIEKYPEYKCLILCDMGSRHRKLLEEMAVNLKLNIVILDHHIPSAESVSSEKIHEVNPWNYGINGSTQVSTAGITYLLAKELDKDVGEKSVHLAVIGALGDRQDQGEKCDFLGLNKLILKDALERKIISREINIRLFGIRRRPLHKCLEYTIEPYIPGLTGDERACIDFLKRISIEPFDHEGKPRYLKDLSEDEVKTLVVELVKHMICEGVPPQEAEKILGYSYFINAYEKYPELYDAREFASLLNACGRLREEWIGILICLNKLSYYNEVLNILNKYRRILSETLKTISEEKVPINYLNKTIVVDCFSLIDERISGAISSILSSKPMFKGKYTLLALIASSSKPNHVKVSFRLLKDIPKFSLGDLVSKIAKITGCEAGGHEKAAGATIPEEKINWFLRTLERELP